MEWISIYDKTKKPEIDQVVVAWLSKWKEPACVRYTEDAHGPLWVELVEVSIGMHREDLISHWMPLPKAPKE